MYLRATFTLLCPVCAMIALSLTPAAALVANPARWYVYSEEDDGLIVVPAGRGSYDKTLRQWKLLR